MAWYMYWRQHWGPPIVEATVFGNHMSAAAGSFDVAGNNPVGHKGRGVNTDRTLPTSTLYFSPTEHSCGWLLMTLRSLAVLSSEEVLLVGSSRCLPCR